jgi:hypothetical protein
MVISEFAKKSAPPESDPANKIDPAAGGAYFIRVVRCLLSAAEEQPEQNDHRDRHPDQPKQNSFSHSRLQ